MTFFLLSFFGDSFEWAEVFFLSFFIHLHNFILDATSFFVFDEIVWTV